MKVIRAKSAGFCWGVERAINIARSYASEEKKPVYTDGPLIHNSQMMAQLEEEGIRKLGDYESSGELEISQEDKEGEAVMLVRAHGISPERRHYLKSLGLTFRDATCPDVGVIAGKIRTCARKGYATVIFGDPRHPEVIGLLGYAMGKGHVVVCEDDVRALPSLGEKVCMVSQSTMFTHEFVRLSGLLREDYPDLLVFDTICGATKERQDDVVKLVEAGAQAIVVIGGHHSSNTKKLALLVENQGVPAFHVETSQGLDLEALRVYQTIGVTAGASTPAFLIEEVCQQLEQLP